MAGGEKKSEYVPGTRLAEKTQKNVDKILRKMLNHIGAQNFAKLDPAATPKEVEYYVSYHLKTFDIEALRDSYSPGEIMHALRQIGQRLQEEALENERKISKASRVVSTLKSYFPWAETSVEKAKKEFELKEIQRKLLERVLPPGADESMKSIVLFVHALLADEDFPNQIDNWKSGGKGFSGYAAKVYFDLFKRSRDPVFSTEILGRITKVAMDLYEDQTQQQRRRR